MGSIGDLGLVALLVALLMPVSLPVGWLTGPGSITGPLSVLVLAGVVLAPRSLASNVLSRRPLRWAGARSYGLYLYHFPVLQLLRHHAPMGPDWLRMVCGIGIALLVAEASFRWVEQPFLRLKDQQPDFRTHRNGDRAIKSGAVPDET